MIKLIATDLDGTLMSPDHLTVSKYTVNVLKSAHDKGIKLAVATGRPLALTGDVIDQVPFTDYIIYSNGACVFDRNEERICCSSLIPNETALELIDYLLSNKVFFEVYAEGKSYYQLDTEYLFENTFFSKAFIDEVMMSMTGCRNLSEYLGDKAVEKITLYSVKDKDYDKFRDKFLSYDLSVASSFEANLEATAKTADKGEAVKGICSEMGITSDECMAFGDAGNDCPMLRFAEYSFAMANGTDECKAAAKYIAKSNAEDGLARAVEEYAINNCT